MHIFISHPINDLELAKKLRDVLESDENIDEAYIAIDKPEYELDIPEKIITKMNDSDYLAAIITANTLQSASVHQEIGYAQAIGLTRIPLLEEGAKAGFLHTSKDKIMFTRENFTEACNLALNYIINHGAKKKKYSNEEGKLIQKSAHYRQILEYRISGFLDSVYYRFNVGENNYPGLIGHGDPKLTKEYIGKIKKFFNKSENELISRMSEIDFSMFEKLDSELMYCKGEIEAAERFSHLDLLQQEADLIENLKENLLHMNEKDLDIRHYCRSIYDDRQNFDFETCSQMMKIKRYHDEIRGTLRWVLVDLSRIIFLMIELTEVFLQYKEKYGDLAFKHPG